MEPAAAGTDADVVVNSNIYYDFHTQIEPTAVLHYDN